MNLVEVHNLKISVKPLLVNLGILLATQFVMILPIISSMLCTVIVFLLPSSFFERILSYFELMKMKIRWRLLKRGEALLLWLIHHSGNTPVAPTDLVALPQYKFYTDILVELLEHLRRFGGPRSALLLSFRKQLKDDLQFEMKIDRLVFGGICQFLAISLITWFFILMTSFVAGFHADSLILWIVLCLQMVGGVLFYYLISKKKREKLAPFTTFYKVIAIIKLTIGTGISVGECLNRSGIAAIMTPTFKWGVHLKERLNLLVTLWQREGGAMATALDEIMDELLFLRDEDFERLQKVATALKFLILTLFYLSSYLLFVFSMLSHFLH